MRNTPFRAAKIVFRSGATAAAIAVLVAASPAAAQSSSPGTAAAPTAARAGCDRACLIDLADRFMAALVDKRFVALPWAERVRFTENDVGLMMGDGVWGTVTKVDDDPFRLADPATGNVLWVGIVEEHGQPAYYAMRLAVEDGKIAEVETVVAREGTPAHFAPTAGYEVDDTFSTPLPAAERRPRERMIALVEGYYDTMQLNDGQLLGEFADDCTRISNGVDMTHGENVPAQGCRAQFEIGYYKPVDRVRARRYPIVDEERGVVVAFAMLDHAARYTEYRTLDGRTLTIPVEYPNSHRV
ncbi:MAG TPA: hypothetical protein VF339_19375, partial [Gammaproteobacteria bacterium]